MDERDGRDGGIIIRLRPFFFSLSLFCSAETNTHPPPCAKPHSHVGRRREHVSQIAYVGLVPRFSCPRVHPPPFHKPLSPNRTASPSSPFITSTTPTSTQFAPDARRGDITLVRDLHSGWSRCLPCHQCLSRQDLLQPRRVLAGTRSRAQDHLWLRLPDLGVGRGSPVCPPPCLLCSPV